MPCVHRLALSCVCLGSFVPAAGAARAPDTNALSLASPTPDVRLRELNTDRPDVTEGPSTGEAGRARIEIDFARFSRNQGGGAQTTEWGVVHPTDDARWFAGISLLS